MSKRLWRRAMAMILAISQGRPKRWTSIMARVLGVMAFSISWGDMLKVSRSTSTRTGVSPRFKIGNTVVAQVTAGVMTSSPG